jgi:hypothetical protein
MVKGEDSQLSGCGFESWRRILDGVSESSYYNEKGNKSSQIRHAKKIFKNKVQNFGYMCGRGTPNVKKQETKYITAAHEKHVRQFENN